MKLIFKREIIAACLILPFSVRAFAMGGDYGPGESASHPDTWPPRLVALANLPTRVAGYFANQDDYLAFMGDTAGFRAFLDACLRLSEFAPTTLHIHRGAGSFQPLDKARKPFSCDWQLNVINQRWRAREPNPKASSYSMDLHVWPEGGVDIAAVEIPPTVKTIKEVDSETGPSDPVAQPPSSAPLPTGAEVWGVSTAGLDMSIRPVRSAWTSGDDPEFQVGIRNSGDKDVFLNLGITLANGLKLFPEAVMLVLMDPEGVSHELEPFGSVINGRVDDYAVGLQMGAVHLLKLKLSQFLSKTLPGDKISLRNGRYKIAARFAGHGAQHKNTGMDWIAWNFWEGTLKSNIATFDVRN